MCSKRLEIALSPIWITYLYGHVSPQLTSYIMHSSLSLAQGYGQEETHNSVGLVDIGRHTREDRARGMIDAQRSTNAKSMLNLADVQLL